MQCPNCGHQINPTAGDWHPLADFQSTAIVPFPKNDAAQVGFKSAIRKTPFRKKDPVSDVLTPFAQAFVTGLMVTLCGSFLAALNGWQWYSGLLAGVIITFVAWVVLLYASHTMLWIIEEITGRDIDGDGHAGKPEKRVIELEVHEGQSTKIQTFPGEEKQVIRFALAVIRGGTFSERTAQRSGYGVTNFTKMRDIFIQRRWAAWNDPNAPQQGVGLTETGQQVIKRLSEAPLSPTKGDEA